MQNGTECYNRHYSQLVRDIGIFQLLLMSQHVDSIFNVVSDRGGAQFDQSVHLNRQYIL